MEVLESPLSKQQQQQLSFRFCMCVYGQTQVCVYVQVCQGLCCVFVSVRLSVCMPVYVYVFLCVCLFMCFLLFTCAPLDFSFQKTFQSFESCAARERRHGGVAAGRYG